ncbi:MAG: glycosyltransferase, partial [Candidatus Bathyarchaeota archaeon]|nr:glycosyltransferase [Candidatus Bathyarchaeota archaeon]
MRQCGIGGINRFMYIQDKLLSICITSYNRVNELKRCVESIRTKYPIDVEIVISEDHSEQREIIRSLIEELKKKTTIELRFYSNNENLGYDMNLYQLIALSKGKYILFLSDDDSLVENSID